MWSRKLIIFLIRKRFGLKPYEKFRFNNQKSNAVYYVTEVNIMKSWRGYTEPSRVSINWLLDDNCKITKVKE